MDLFNIQDVTFLDKIVYQNFAIKKDKFTFIVGKSGTGKSTLLKLLNKTAKYSSGNILYSGKNLKEISPIPHRREVLLAIQNFYLFDASIKDNFIKFYENREENIISDDRIKDMLSLCLIDFDLDKDCKNLSGGERHRVFLAICLSFMPSVILLDEPTSALDKETSINLFKNIKNFCKNNFISCISVCHSEELVEMFADEIIRL